jgi:hypothetical protein
MIAQEFLSENSKDQLKLLLPSDNGYLGNVASWADEIKQDRRKWGWASEYHYIDTHDKPGQDCFVNEETDCVDNSCIVGAIANYTEQAKCSFAPNQSREYAVKFLTHFIGDITMPLHNSGRLVGGNKAYVTFDEKQEIDGYKVNLHNTWDFHIPNKLILRNYKDSVDVFVQDMAKQIKTGEYKDLAPTWISENSYDEQTPLRNSVSALAWSRDSNILNCKENIWDSYDEDPKKDLGGDYYERAVPLVKIQIAKAGYRMAHHFNSIFDTCISPTKDAEDTTTITSEDSQSISTAQPISTFILIATSQIFDETLTILSADTTLTSVCTTISESTDSTATMEDCASTNCHVTSEISFETDIQSRTNTVTTTPTIEHWREPILSSAISFAPVSFIASLLLL